MLENWKQNCHMTQQSRCWENTPRKSELEETRVPQCSLQHCLQKLAHGSNLDVHQLMNGYEAVVHIHTGILLSYKKECIQSVLMRWMKLEPTIQSKVSQGEKHQYSILMHKFGF